MLYVLSIHTYQKQFQDLEKIHPRITDSMNSLCIFSSILLDEYSLAVNKLVSKIFEQRHQ